MGARLAKSLLQNGNAGGNRKHRDHRTHRVNNLPKMKHDRIWIAKKAAKYARREDNEAIQESLNAMAQQES